MIKLKRMLVPENMIDFDDVCSARTESYIILWNHIKDCFVLVEDESTTFECFDLPHCENFDELDEVVHNICGEHIEEVSQSNKYKLTLME